MLNNQEPSTPVLIQDLGAIYPTATSKIKRKFGLYKCSCGVEYKARVDSVNSGGSKSCGCYKNNASATRLLVHGLRSHRLYHIWQGMIQRCTNKTSKKYFRYGSRGITVCDRWHNIENFIEDMYPTYKEGLTIDRIDNDGNYEPSNCRWATKATQAQNTRLINSTNTSGYRGVSLDKSENKWMARIEVHTKSKYLGSFHTAIEAAQAYDKYVMDNNLEHTINNA